MIGEHRFALASDAVDDLAWDIVARLSDAVTKRGIATLAVSGGRSPIPLFKTLSDMAIDWARVTVFLVDERWVAVDHPDSNEKLVRDHLLTGRAAAARFVGMKNDAAHPWAGQATCEAAIGALPRPFDLMLLGMGEDGHTASLFPDAAELAEGLTTQALTLAVQPPMAPHARMSLSLAAILSSRRILMQIGGFAKAAVLARALGDGPVQDMPIRAVLRQDIVPVDIWISE